MGRPPHGGIFLKAMGGGAVGLRCWRDNEFGVS
jgi:hypothetical protein